MLPNCKPSNPNDGGTTSVAEKESQTESGESEVQRDTYTKEKGKEIEGEENVCSASSDTKRQEKETEIEARDNKNKGKERETEQQENVKKNTEKVRESVNKKEKERQTSVNNKNKENERQTESVNKGKERETEDDERFDIKDKRREEELEEIHEQGLRYYKGIDERQDFRRAFELFKKAGEYGYLRSQYNLGVCYKQGRGVPQDFRLAVEWFRKAEMGGHPGAMFGLGLCCYQGVPISDASFSNDTNSLSDGTAGGNDRNKQAFEWFKKAGEKGHPRGQYYVALFYLHGEGQKKDHKKAVEWFTKAGEGGDLDALFNLGECYTKGRGVAQNNALAFEFFRKAGEAGHARAQYHLGVCYLNALGVDEDDELAVEWFKKAGEAGDVDALFQLGQCCYEGRGANQNLDLAFELFKKAALEGHTEAQLALGRCYLNGSGTAEGDDAQAAVEWLTKAAKAGNVRAQQSLGMYYSDGRRVKENYELAYKWFLKAAEGGESLSQFHLFLLLSKGLGVKRDTRQAFVWLHKAAVSDVPHLEAQYFLGVCFYTGTGVPQNYEKAFEWFKKAAKAGHLESIFNVGVCYSQGVGVCQSPRKEVKWYATAAKEGHPGAQCNLGVCYKEGNGVEQDREEAFKWFKEAGRRGHLVGQYKTGVSYKEGCGVPQDDEKALKWWHKAAVGGSCVSQFLLSQNQTDDHDYRHLLRSLRSADSFTFREIQLRQVPPIEFENGELKASSEHLDKTQQQNVGKGRFGVVTKCHWKNKEVAIKELKFDPFSTVTITKNGAIKNSNTIKDFMREIEAILSLKPHPHVHRVLAFCISPLCLVTELMDNDLCSVLKLSQNTEQQFDVATLLRFVKEIALGMRFLHQNKLVHRYLSAHNVLVNEKMECKISDFGLSRYVLQKTENKEGIAVEEIVEQVGDAPGGLHGSQVEPRKFYVCRIGRNQPIPIRWLAPEAIDLVNNVIRFSYESDVWGFGVTVWEIFSYGKQPYFPRHAKFGEEHYLALRSGDIHLHCPPDCPPFLWKLLALPCLLLAPRDRPGFDSIVDTLSTVETKVNSKQQLMKEKGNKCVVPQRLQRTLLSASNWLRGQQQQQTNKRTGKK